MVRSAANHRGISLSGDWSPESFRFGEI